MPPEAATPVPSWVAASETSVDASVPPGAAASRPSVAASVPPGVAEPFPPETSRQVCASAVTEPGAPFDIVEGPEVPEALEVLEVGPGLGALTRPLLNLGLRVRAVELDRGLHAELVKWPEASSGLLNAVQADILEVDAARAFPAGIACVCGNLPYGISTPFLFWFLEAFGGRVPGVFMLQKEVAERLAAKPGGREYGRLSVALGSWFDASEAFALGPGSFHPRPKVDSAVAVLRPKGEVPPVTPAVLARITKLCFHSRRKTLANNLTAACGREKALATLDALGMDGGRRPEEFPPEDYQRLALALKF
ncbi:MAG: 16S rRNA (adenine(1518)-N(6)/adenine(1519)-N(6))-dimethyltransferase RsmA [Deltaproteobacteria bacterium]|nr:16S rRNA (adenine(1518)-N(6)/adenine(1519)-N(6))-dimethyltransferase RsmA [Deltaproteobacteria bacterium]